MPGVPVDLAVIAFIQDLLDGLGLPAEALRFEAIDGAAIHCSETLCVIVGHDERQTDLKRRYECLCNMDFDGHHVWVGVPSASSVLKRHASPVIVSEGLHNLGAHRPM